MLFLGQPSALGTTGAVNLAVIFPVLFPLLFGWIIGLSALGGYLGMSLRPESRSPSREAVSPGRG